MKTNYQRRCKPDSKPNSLVMSVLKKVGVTGFRTASSYGYGLKIRLDL